MTVPSGRSLIAAEFLPPECDGDIRVMLTCDCGMSTDLTVTLKDAASGRGGEAAFTCDGCGTSHWFTVSADPEATEDPACE
jgi:hypothetical protein